jgi:hypothetical protein
MEGKRMMMLNWNSHFHFPSELAGLMIDDIALGHPVNQIITNLKRDKENSYKKYENFYQKIIDELESIEKKFPDASILSSQCWALNEKYYNKGSRPFILSKVANSLVNDCFCKTGGGVVLYLFPFIMENGYCIRSVPTYYEIGYWTKGVKKLIVSNWEKKMQENGLPEEIIKKINEYLIEKKMVSDEQ